MARLNSVTVITETATVSDSGTDDRIELVYCDDKETVRCVRLNRKSRDDHESGRIDVYGPLKITGVKDTTPRFVLRAKGNDAWLPERVVILGDNGGGSSLSTMIANVDWPRTAWLSTQSTDGDGKAKKSRYIEAGAPAAPEIFN